MSAGYGLVLILVTASIGLQLLSTGGSGSRLITLVLQAATLVAAVWTAGVRRPIVRLAAGVAVLLVIAAAVLWLVHGSVPPATAGIVNGLLVAVAPATLAGDSCGPSARRRGDHSHCGGSAGDLSAGRNVLLVPVQRDRSLRP